MPIVTFGIGTVADQNPTKASTQTCRYSNNVCQLDVVEGVDHNEIGQILSLALHFSLPVIMALAVLLAYRLFRYWVFRWHLRHGSRVARVAASTLRALRTERSCAFPPAKHLWYTAANESEPPQPFLCTACAGHIAFAPSLNHYIQCCAACGAVAHEACLRHIDDTCRPFSVKEASHFWTVAGTCKRIDDNTYGERVDRVTGASRRNKSAGNMIAPCLYCENEAAGSALADEPTWECACCNSLAHVSCFCDYHPNLTLVRSKFFSKLGKLGNESSYPHFMDNKRVGTSPLLDSLSQDTSSHADKCRDKIRNSDMNIDLKDFCSHGPLGKVVLPPVAVQPIQTEPNDDDKLLTGHGTGKRKKGTLADDYSHKQDEDDGEADGKGEGECAGEDRKAKNTKQRSQRRGKRWFWKKVFAPMYRPIRRNEWRIHLHTMTEPLEPVLVFVNIKSGAQLGEEIRRKLLRILHPLQVVALPREDPFTALKLFACIPLVRILCIGGDGTVGWIMGCLDKIANEHKEIGTTWTAPPVAVIPLGTGNDLARCLDWGGGFGAWRQEGPHGMLKAVLHAQTTYLDRWTLSLSPQESTDRIQILRGNKEKGWEFASQGVSLLRSLFSSYHTKALTSSRQQTSAKPAKELAMNNYLGIGVDAKVAFEFHELREAYPQWFQSQFGNKLMYTGVGALDIVGQLSGAEQIDLPSKMEIICDGVAVQLPRGCEGVLLVNIPSYMGGVNLWASSTGCTTMDKTVGKQSMSDGMLEIVAVYGSWHLGRLTVGLSKALRLQQGRKVEITTWDTLPMQVDGEPFIQQPAKISVSLRGQALVLRHVKKLASSRIMESLMAALEAATDEGVISPSQQRDLTSRLKPSTDSENGI